MLYQVQVYTLVAIIVALPFLLLYLALVLSHLAALAVRSIIQSLKNALALRQGFAKQYWSLHHR